MDNQKTLKESLSWSYNNTFVKVFKTHYAHYLGSKEDDDTEIEIVYKEDENRSFTERLKRAVASGLDIHPFLLKKLQNNQEIGATLDFPYKRGLLAAKGETTILPKIINPQAFIKITVPLFTIGELIEIREYGYLGYVVGVQVIDYKDPYLSWAYDVLLVHSLYQGSYHPENFLEDELDKISSLRRYPMKVNSPKVKIGNVIQDKEGFTPIARIVTKINWHSYINFEDYLDKIPELAPFYSYNLTKWNEEKNSLDESNVRCFVREGINNE